jgi:hypothetical protein
MRLRILERCGCSRAVRSVLNLKLSNLMLWYFKLLMHVTRGTEVGRFSILLRQELRKGGTNDPTPSSCTDDTEFVSTMHTMRESVR